MTEPSAVKACDALHARIDALQKMLDEREERNKERFAAIKESVAAALSAADKALNKAETTSEKRFDSVNEFRETLSDQASHFMTTEVYNVQHKALADRLDGLATRFLVYEGKNTGKSEGIGTVGTVVLNILVGLNAFLAITTGILFFMHVAKP